MYEVTLVRRVKTNATFPYAGGYLEGIFRKAASFSRTELQATC